MIGAPSATYTHKYRPALTDFLGEGTAHHRSGMTTYRHEVLERATREGREGSITVLDCPGREWPIRFLAAPAQEDGIWAQPVEPRWNEINDAIARGSEVEGAVAIDRARHAFRTTLARRDRHLWLNEAIMVDAFLLRMPTEIRIDERRAHPRFLVPDGSTVFAQLTRATKGRPTVEVRPWDLSAGGACFVCPSDQKLAKLRRGEVLKVLIHYRGKTIAGPAEVCFSRAITGRVVKVGVRFKPEAIDQASRDNLRELLDELARLAAQRGRTGR